MKESITIRAEKELLDFLKKKAEDDFRTTNNYIEMVLTKHKQDAERKEKPESK